MNTSVGLKRVTFIHSRLLSFCSTHSFQTNSLSSLSEANEISLSYDLADKYKSDRALVIAHGLFASRASWKSVAKRLNEQTKYKIYTVDMRNHGLSEYTSNMNYSLMANDLKKFLNEIVYEKDQVKHITLMGHSMGGKASMAFALENTENCLLIDKLIIADIAPTTSPSFGNISKYLEKMSSIDMNELVECKNLSDARRIVDMKLSELDLLKNDYNQRQFILTRLVSTSKSGVGQYDWHFNLPTIRANIRSIMEFPSYETKFYKRSLFIYGERSGYITSNEVRAIEAHFKNVKFIQVPQAGHVIHFDNPTFTINSINEFLKE